MATVQSYQDTIKTQLESVAGVAPFKAVTFGDIGVNIEYPSIHFRLDGMEKFEDVHLVNTTMQLRWELTYKVHVLCAGLSYPESWEECIKTVNEAVELFINHIPETERLSGNAWWIEPENVVYGAIEVDAAIDQIGVQGGFFDLKILFLQDVS